jgi:hypothetical protein
MEIKMKELTHCPFCEGDFLIKEVECHGCKTQIKGCFKPNRFHLFNPEDLLFIELFLKNEGNIKLMEKDLSVSYPTIKGRLKSIITTLGYNAQENHTTQRMKILTDLSDGKVDVESAIKHLKDIK